MKISQLFAYILASWLVLAALPSFAQLSVDLSLQEKKTILYEPVIARLHLKNSLGKPIHFGVASTDARLIFDIQTSSGDYIFPASEDPVLTGIDISPNETHTLDINLSNLYPLQKLGRFKIKAIIEWRGVTYASAPRSLEISNGVEFMRLKAAIPNENEDIHGYLLKTMSRDDGYGLYLVIEDETGDRICGLVNLGCFIRMPEPSMRIDEVGNLHILFRAVGGNFVHAAFTPFGVRLFSNAIAPGVGGKAELVNLPNGDITVQTIQMLPAKPDASEQKKRSKFDWIFPNRN